MHACTQHACQYRGKPGSWLNTPADDPVQSIRWDVEGRLHQRVVEVQGGSGGVRAGRIQPRRFKQGGHASVFLSQWESSCHYNSAPLWWLQNYGHDVPSYMLWKNILAALPRSMLLKTHSWWSSGPSLELQTVHFQCWIKNKTDQTFYCYCVHPYLRNIKAQYKRCIHIFTWKRHFLKLLVHVTGLCSPYSLGNASCTGCIQIIHVKSGLIDNCLNCFELKMGI